MSTMRKLLTLVYGVMVYGLFGLTWIYFLGFLGGFPVPKSVDSGPIAPVPEALAIDLGCLALFFAHHSVMARARAKRAIARFVPPAVERSTFVLLASLALILLYWQWRPMTDIIWSVADPLGAMMLEVVSGIGWAVVLASTFMINHFELFGLRQVLARLLRQELPPAKFKTPMLYKSVRHPIYLGFLIAFWATPVMTAGHLLFAIATTGYILIGIWLEERDLIALFGDQYRRYREQVSMLIPLPGRKSRADDLG